MYLVTILSADDASLPFAYLVYELKGAQCSYVETLGVVGMLYSSDWIRIQSGTVQPESNVCFRKPYLAESR
jgi:hypothetical protein